MGGVGTKVVPVRVYVGNLDIAVGRAEMTVQVEHRQLVRMTATGVSSKQVMVKL